ncbi:MAG: hypothetical protein M3Z28_11735 [Candidatus Dormibacteraeota bacterium]|nr:hypothetical protein [Candidatus Dormibacteraeota bacterium]
MTEPPVKPSSTIELPAAQLSVGPREDMFPVRHRDWNRIRNRVKELTSPIPYAASVGWACVGIAPTAALAFIAWLAAYAQLSPAAQLQFNWVGPLMAVIFVAAGGGAWYSFWIASQAGDVIRRDAQHVVEDMDEIYAPYKEP